MHPIAQKIAILERRIRYRAYASAMCMTAAALLAAAIALGFTDYLVLFRDPGLLIIARSSSSNNPKTTQRPARPS
jgi:hypothetical protein